MALWRIITLAFAASIFVEAKWHPKREAPLNICEPIYTNASSLQCYCVVDHRNSDIVKSAECHLTKKDVQPDHIDWNGFEKLKPATKLTLSNTRGIPLKYIPTNALKITQALVKLDIKYGTIKKIEPFAFANLSAVEEITLSDNQIEVLAVNAFAHHRDLTIIGLDTNNIVEINRNVFVDLPSLEKLFLTNNRITTIHDKAFVHLTNLRELEMDRNNLFSLNSETFFGLRSLHKLDLSGNSLEVIGDNTFLPLTSLQTLNLDSNKIQMLDEKAFHGLDHLFALSLAHNNLTSIDNVKTFEGLNSLTLLSLKSNKLVELKPEVMAPILSNFYGNTSTLDVEDNNFPCDCRLDWFMALMNKTQHSYLRLAIENLKCTPNEALRELWAKTTEAEKNAAQVFEEQASVQNGDYEYYDEEQLNGKLFYIDVRDLANCTKHFPGIPVVGNKYTSTISTTTVELTTKIATTKVLTSSQITPKHTTTNKVTETAENIEKPNNNIKSKDSFTTVRLATVSAKPEHADHDNMASDEARPERIKAHRSIQDKDVPKYQASNANANFSNFLVIAITLCYRLCF